MDEVSYDRNELGRTGAGGMALLAINGPIQQPRLERPRLLCRLPVGWLTIGCHVPGPESLVLQDVLR